MLITTGFKHPNIFANSELDKIPVGEHLVMKNIIWAKLAQALYFLNTS